MSDWREPITDRMATDVAGADAGSLVYQKGALNADDLNRIEGNYRYILEHLETDAIFIPHAYRNRGETTIEIVDVPTEYTPVEYIESSGTQYINTGHKANQNTGVVLDFYRVNSAAQWIFGSRTSSSSSDCFLCLCADDNKIRDDYGSEKISTGITPSERMTIDKNKNVTVIGGQTFNHTTAEFAGLDIFLFAGNNGGGVTGQASIRLYSCKIYDDETLIRDFIPVKDASGVACLYDKVSQAYFYNAGTGAFTSGTELTKETTKEIIEVKRKYTDWQEHNLPWLSEINRIRANYNALVRLFLVGLGLPILAESNYLDWQEVNDWERIADVGKTIFENMEQEYRYCGVEESGGDRLL